ncbi:copper chaperone PCu(A)C [Micrococcus sp. M4NT]|uniref:copper chaperone PCu(A)C n=1 Tax=Micrococcus sp. M4NT TaxID=2957501 RepID=UPI0029B2501A|nr:copper chaperone PCu(A)C [Micrococcus sp. M4NT]MDX2340675.1 copper chaperone PCu(A)C [Micrococcus sp. M4NT]
MPSNTTHPSSRPSSRLGLAAVLAASALTLSACTGGAEPAPTSSAAAGSAATVSASSAPGAASSSPAASGSGTAASEGAQAASLRVVDPWTKAVDGAMTGSFGTLENASDAPLHIVSVTSPSAPRAELHEMADGPNGQKVMRETEDGLTVPAGGSLELVPGGRHVMLMGLTDPVEPGEEVAYTLALEDGSTLDVRSLARPFTGANESYHGGEAGAAAPSSLDHSGMEHGTSSAAAPGSAGHGDH